MLKYKFPNFIRLILQTYLKMSTIEEMFIKARWFFRSLKKDSIIQENPRKRRKYNGILRKGFYCQEL